MRHRKHGRHGHGEPFLGPEREVPRRHRLHRRLFWWFGAAILFTALAAFAVVSAVRPDGDRWNPRAFRDVAEHGFRAAWPDPAARRDLAASVAEAFDASVTLRDADGRVLEQIGPECRGFSRYDLEVRGANGPLGSVHGCMHPHRRGYVFLFALVAAGSALWAASLLIARRLTRPLGELVRVTRAIGGGDLAARVRLGRHQTGEVGALADSVNEMAARIERQLREERTLLAAVSHEIRSPLARLRVLVELARGGDPARLAEIDAELVGMDALIGKLLASSRLEFGELAPQRQAASALGRRALEAASLPETLLDDRTSGAELDVDLTLVGRALGNLLENANRHGGGVERLLVTAEGDRVRFEVLDRGPGFAPEVLSRAFEAFYAGRASPSAQGSLGLGLALVARIARAHGGRAFAENRPEAGARAVLELPGPRAP
ncbi:MAG TPA: HAMP domain-containing sensor histidine kinase [Polyangiaceae bacterium]